MGVMLFKDGDKHEFHGVKCEFKVFPVEQLRSALDEGWRTDHEPNNDKGSADDDLFRIPEPAKKRGRRKTRK